MYLQYWPTYGAVLEVQAKQVEIYKATFKIFAKFSGMRQERLILSVQSLINSARFCFNLQTLKVFNAVEMSKFLWLSKSFCR